MMYNEKKLYLTNNQLKNLSNAVNKKTSVSFRINPKQNGNVPILLTKTQVSKISKGVPFNLKLSTAQVKALAKHGGFLITLPTILAAASAIGSLAGGASAIAKTINDKKTADKKLKEEERHNRQMEGKGLFLKPHPRRKTGEGLYLKPFKK